MKTKLKKPGPFLLLGGILLALAGCEASAPVRPTPAPGPITGPVPVPPVTRPHHAVVSSKELFILHPNVLQAAQSRSHPWHIRTALARIAGGRDVDQFAEAWFQLWEDTKQVPGADEVVQPRRAVADALRNAWKNDRIRLIAIASRMDLARFPDSDRTQPPDTLGEGRFIYEVLDAQNRPLRCTLIFEYALPLKPGLDPRLALRDWAQRWHALGRPEFGSPTEAPAAYLTALQSLTDEFSAHGNLNQIRSNELLDGGPWELREFHFSKTNGNLFAAPVHLTALADSNDKADLAAFVNQNAAALEAGRPIHLVPSLQGAVSQVPSPSFKWNINAAPRPAFNFAFNTCSGCHAAATDTFFQHVGVSVQTPGGVSPFLSGEITLEQPLPPLDNTGTKHNEMQERRDVLAEFADDLPPFSTKATSEKVVSKILKSRVNRPH